MVHSGSTFFGPEAEGGGGGCRKLHDAARALTMDSRIHRLKGIVCL